MFRSHCTILDSLEFVRRNAEIRAGRAGTDAPPPDDPDLANLDLIYTPPQSPRRKRTKEEQHALDEHAMGLRAHGKTFRQIAAQLGITPSSAFNRVKRHLHRQREAFEEHVADVRDYDLLTLKLMDPMHVKKGREGDARSYALVMRAMELRHKLLKIRNPTAADELLKMTDLAQQLAKGFDDLLIEIEESGVGRAEEDDHEQAAEFVRTEREQAPQPIANMEDAVQENFRAERSGQCEEQAALSREAKSEMAPVSLPQELQLP